MSPIETNPIDTNPIGTNPIATIPLGAIPKEIILRFFLELFSCVNWFSNKLKAWSLTEATKFIRIGVPRSLELCSFFI